jgi:hypothetical protein
MNTTLSQKYYRYSVISLLIVAILGTLMRYKIAYSLPIFEQKNLLHAHSHFAFSGWISHVLYCGMASIILKHVLKALRYINHSKSDIFRNAHRLYDTGYKNISILFSTGTIFIQYYLPFNLLWIGVRYQASSIQKLVNSCRIIECVGVPYFFCIYDYDQDNNHNNYLGSVYYYLHFEYNGWFSLPP